MPRGLFRPPVPAVWTRVKKQRRIGETMAASDWAHPSRKQARRCKPTHWPRKNGTNPSAAWSSPFKRRGFYGDHKA
jgi:hypothetical protein